MWSSIRFRWHLLDRSDLLWLAAVGLFVAVLGSITGFAYVDYARRAAAQQRQVDLVCLAENVYYEARGEPLAGQYAVAEVTMNRVSSPIFPSTVCGVVHAGHYDVALARYTGAFSWTGPGSREPPYGYEWRRAKAVAATVYDNSREAPLVDGALFYHATYVTPDWADGKTRVARIGRHIFYE